MTDENYRTKFEGYKMELLDSKQSGLVSEYLEREGYGVLNRNENKWTQLIGQLAELLCISYKSITSGGQAEGSGLQGDSDSDVMGVIKGFYVSDDQNMPNSGFDKDGDAYIRIKRNKRYPGFCKLEISQKCYDRLRNPSLVRNTTTFTRQLIQFVQIQTCVIQRGTTLLISSKLIKNTFSCKGLGLPDTFDAPLYEENGPALCYRNKDFVRSFQFKIWPEEAKMWKERRRKHNWPRREVLDRLEKEVSCYVVPKGIEDFEVEWNLSFVEIERELIWEMNDTQFKCYICLKKIKKLFLKEKRDTGLEKISIYQLKNIMFWMCEIIPEHEWKTENLFRYVRLGLMKFQNCIRQGYNAHFFIPEMNLWRNVQLSASEKRNAFNVLTTLIEGRLMVYFILYVSSTFNKDIRNIYKIMAYNRRRDILMSYGALCSTEITFEHFCKIFSRFPETNVLSPCMAITKGKLRVLQMHQKYSQEFYKNISIDAIVQGMKDGYKIDYLTASLNIALVFNFFRRYSDVRKELKTKLSNNTRKVFLWGDLQYDIVLNTAEVRRVNYDISDLTEDKQNVVFEFVLYESKIDMLLFPFPLKLQKYVLGERNLFSISPIVLAYYLLFTSEYYLRLTGELESTRSLLVLSVLNSISLPNYYIHLYLLGYSFYMTGDMEEAYHWFAKSAVKNPSHLNAAVYQLGSMINDEIQGRTK